MTRHVLRTLLLWAAAAGLPGTAGADDWAALLDTAWVQRQATAEARLAQAEAGVGAAAARLPDAPTLTLAGRGDRVDPRRGAREWEAELAAPLWWPGQRERALAVAEAERALQRTTLARQRWQLAGELREVIWSLRLARADADAASARQLRATRLADDIERRVRAGDLAPLDLNQARTALATARADALRAAALARAAAQRLTALAPDARAPERAEAQARPGAEHPQLAELEARARLSSARLVQAGHDTRDAPELALALTRERDDPAQPWQQRARLALRVPLGEASASTPRRAAAAADEAEARQALHLARRQQAAEHAAAEAELAAARGAEAALAERAALAQQSLDWVEQAFRAGQLGAPALLHAAAEQAEAHAQAERSRLEAARAVSRLNQILGSMP